MANLIEFSSALLGAWLASLITEKLSLSEAVKRASLYVSFPSKPNRATR